MSFTLQVGEHFAPGSKVEVHPRVTDTAPAGYGKPVKTAKVDNSGEVKLDGLVPFGDYWLTGENVTGDDRTVAVTVPGRTTAPASSQEGLAEELRLRGEAQNKIRSDHAHLEPASHVPASEARDLVGDVPDHNFEKSSSKESEPAPHVKQADIGKSVPQRSATPLGQATPVDPDEWQPRVPQHAVKKGTPQRSDTELGEATPVDPKEFEPGVPQDAVKGKQRSDTPEGTAEPVAKGSKVEIEKAKDSSVSAAVGATPGKAKAGTSKAKGRQDPAAAVKKQTKKDQREAQS